ncbi:hypothetical protein [Rhizobacter fulvus]
MRPRRHRLIGLAVLAGAAVAGLWSSPRLFFGSWLVAWWYLLGLVLGGFVNLWIHRLCGGRWGEVLRPAVLLPARSVPLLLLSFLPLAAGMSALYPWMVEPASTWAASMARPAFPGLWLQPGFFWVRALLYGSLWWWLARPAMLATKGRAAAALALYAVSVTLASVDLLMSLVPGWYSTGFGLVVMSGQALGGTALGVVLLAGSAAPRAPEQPPIWRDFGNLLLMWLMSWAYLAFMELLIIWSENLPHEIAWYVPRLQTGWRWVGVALVLLQLALPLLALLQRRVKDRPRRLKRVAAALLASQLLNTTWLVLPSVAPHDPAGWWLVPLLTVGIALLLFGDLPATLAAGADAGAETRPPPEARHA